MMHNYLILISILTFLIFSCGDNEIRQDSGTQNNTSSQEIKLSHKKDSLRILLNNNISFFADSLLKSDRRIIFNYINENQADTCGIITYPNKELKSSFEGFKILNDINGNKIADSVFVLPPFNYCEEGESYCFYDSKLPRLITDSYCCHPDNIFTVQDMDEDGFKEIGIYYSSCVSRYKSLKIYSLKNEQWKLIGGSVFDIKTQDPDKVQFATLVKKVSKNKFKICNFNEGNTEWLTMVMK